MVYVEQGPGTKALRRSEKSSGGQRHREGGKVEGEKETVSRGTGKRRGDERERERHENLIVHAKELSQQPGVGHRAWGG